MREWHILIWDADPGARNALSDYLRRHGFAVSGAFTIKDMWRKLETQAIDLAVVDLFAPGESGLNLIAQFRRRSDLPLIVSDAVGDNGERVVALELGADDYLHKPLPLRELVARIRALERRARGSGATTSERIYRFAGWSYTPSEHRLLAPRGAVLRLTQSEHSLLLAFIQSAQRVLSRERLLRALRDGDSDASDRSVDMQVWRLRRKLAAHTEPGSALIRTERGAGYCFAVAVSSETLAGTKRGGDHDTE